MVATILVGMLCAHLLCFAVMFLLFSKRLQGKKMGMDAFAMGNLLLSLAYVLQLIEGGAAWSPMSVLNHTLTLASPVAYWIGAMRFFGHSAPLARPLLTFAAAYGIAQVMVQLTLGTVARYAMLSGIAALMFLVMTITVIHGARTFARELDREMVFFGVLIGGLCVLNALKFIKLLDSGVEALQMDRNFQLVFYVYMSFLATVLPPSIVWLVLRRLNDELRGVAARDPLTQLLNRRGLTEALQLQLNSRKTEHAHLLMVDVDHFKRINDTYGHQIGDSVLSSVADALRATARRGDLVSRLGGEEFVVVCLDTDSQGTLQLAERLRSAVERLAIKIPGSEHPLHCTATIGVSLSFANENALAVAMRQADVALYRGKGAGRNRVESFQVTDSIQVNQSISPSMMRQTEATDWRCAGVSQ